MFHVLNQYFASAQAADEPKYGRSGGGAGVHGRSNFGRDYAAKIGRAEREVTINDANRLKAFQALCQLNTGKWPEPAEAHEADFFALLAHLANGDSGRCGERSHAEQNDLRIFCHVFFEERVAVLAAKDALEVGVNFANY